MGAPLLSQKMPSKDSSRGFSSNLLCRLWLIQDMLGAASCNLILCCVWCTTSCCPFDSWCRSQSCREDLLQQWGSTSKVCQIPRSSDLLWWWLEGSWSQCSMGAMGRNFGKRTSRVTFRLNPATTKKRAPGPGPIRKRDWKPIATKLLSNKEVVLHTDGARAYTLKLPKVFHCNVVHKKKKAKINGKVCWLQPQYTKVYTLKLPGGKNLKVKSGTQTIDRFWRHLREEFKGVNRKPGNQPMTRKIRSAQWTYWHKGTNLWEATGRMIQTLLEWKKKRQGSYELQVGQSTCENKVRLLLHCSFCQGNILSFHLWLSASVLPIFLGYHLTNSRMQTFLWKLFFYLKR